MGIVIEDIEAFRHGGDIWEFLHFDLIDDNTNVQSFIMTFALHNMQLSNTLFALGSNLDYWVKPSNTTQLFVLLLTEYDDQQWIQNFKMSKEMLFNITNKLKTLIAKIDTRYWFVIPIKVKVAYVIYKLFHGSNLLTCSE